MQTNNGPDNDHCLHFLLDVAARQLENSLADKLESVSRTQKEIRHEHNKKKKS